MEFNLRMLQIPLSPKSKEDRFSVPSIARSPEPKKSPLKQKELSFPSPISRSPVKKYIPRRPVKQINLSPCLSDYLYNPIDWSSKNCIGIALDSKIVLLPSPFEFRKRFDSDYVEAVSLRFSPLGDKLILGSLLGPIRSFDVQTCTSVTTYNTNQTSALTIDQIDSLIAAGFSDGSISLIDIRAKEFMELKFHSTCCCKTVFSKINQNLLASGSGDSRVGIWDIRKLEKPALKYENHKSTVKAICWSKKTSNVIVTGAGVGDFSIQKWNVNTGETIKYNNVGSQICNLFFSPSEKEIVSTEGYSDFKLNIWDSNELKLLNSIDSHKDRILFSAMSPQSELICTLTEKDPLQIWKLFSNDEEKILLR